MERIDRIWNHPLYRSQFAQLQEAERERKFCRHTLEHFLAVARLMYIYSLEEGRTLDPELIYGAALLHDIGRYEQMSRGTPHHLAGERMAGVILADCGFSKEESGRIRDAILHHRKGGGEDILAACLYRADKQSRNCFACPDEGDCDWPEWKKNKRIRY